MPVIRPWGPAAVLLLGGAFALSRELGNEFLPQVDDGQVGVGMSLPPGTPPQATDAAFRRIEQVIREMPYVETVFTTSGGALWGGVISEQSGQARATVQLTAASARPDMPATRWVSEAERRIASLQIPRACSSARRGSRGSVPASLTPTSRSAS